MKQKIQKFLLFFVMACALMIGMSTKGWAATAVYDTTVTLNGDWATLTMLEDGDILQYNFVVPAAGKLEFTFQSFRDATSYNLYNDDLTTKYLDVGSGGSATSPSTKTSTLWLQAGTYHIRVNDGGANFFGGEGIVRVKIAYTDAELTETEPNNDFTSAMTLSESEPVRAALLKIDDRLDFFKFQVTESNRKTRITLLSYVEAYVCQVYDEQFVSQEKFTARGSESSPATSTVDLDLSPGWYYLKISDDYLGEDHSFGIYTIKWETLPCEHVWDDGTVTKAATAVRTGIKTYTCTLCQTQKTEVLAKLPASVKLSKSSLTIKKGKSSTLKIKSKTTGDSVKSWSSSNKKIATVSKSGVVKAKKKGTVSITVTMASGVKATCKVTVK